MSEPVWIELTEARAIHERQIAEHGGQEGIRDLGLLESALHRPKHLLGYSGSAPSVERLAASYAFGVARNHPFFDGNKRCALVISFTFLELNGREITASQEETYRLFNQLAAGHLNEEELVRWFTQNSDRL